MTCYVLMSFQMVVKKSRPADFCFSFVQIALMSGKSRGDFVTDKGTMRGY